MRKFMSGLVFSLAVLALPAVAEEIQPKTMNGVAYVSGGISDERVYMESVRSQYPLQLMFAVAGSGEYLADVTVDIADQHGKTVLRANSEGPFFFAKLSPGSYKVSVSSDGVTKAKSVTVPQKGSVEERFYW